MNRVIYNRRGIEEYTRTHAFQIETRDRVIRGETDSVLISVRHPAVITVGRGGSGDGITVDPKMLARRKIKIIDVERGGMVTYHHPGQAVMYPVFNLRKFTKDIHEFLRSLERVMIRTLAAFSLTGHPGEKAGVFVGSRKIGSIGIAVKRWVSWHGISLNVHADPCFELISPCGLPPGSMTSLEEEGADADMELVESELEHAFIQEFGIDVTQASQADAHCVQ